MTHSVRCGSSTADTGMVMAGYGGHAKCTLGQPTTCENCMQAGEHKCAPLLSTPSLVPSHLGLLPQPPAAARSTAHSQPGWWGEGQVGRLDDVPHLCTAGQAHLLLLLLRCCASARIVGAAPVDHKLRVSLLLLLLLLAPPQRSLRNTRVHLRPLVWGRARFGGAATTHSRCCSRGPNTAPSPTWWTSPHAGRTHGSGPSRQGSRWDRSLHGASGQGE